MADTGWLYPTTTANGGTGNNIANHANLSADDGSVAEPNGQNLDCEAYLTDFNIGLTTETINGIEVEVQARDTCNDGSYSAECWLSDDGGSNETPVQTFWTGTNPGGPTAYTEFLVGGPSDLMTIAWTGTKLNNTNFRARFRINSDSFPAETQVDYFRVKVHYTAAGGGATGKSNPLSGPLGGPLSGPLG